jgi:phosphoadenosine phosphosulfate reductase
MINPLQNHVARILQLANTFAIEEVINRLAKEFEHKVTFSSSFSYEDQVITHKILTSQLPVSIFTLDTGRLFEETYAVWSATNERYHTRIRAYYPDHKLLEPFVAENGPNSFYESVDQRKACCYIRKVEPLKRALKNKSIWITGIRAEHSSNRHNLEQVEWDEGNQIIKYHPLLHWTTNEVKEYVNEHNIPYNILYDRGFASIGCAPCTRAIKPGEDPRAGRWWWENNTKKECGLHVSCDAQTEKN